MFYARHHLSTNCFKIRQTMDVMMDKSMIDYLINWMNWKCTTGVKKQKIFVAYLVMEEIDGGLSLQII